VCMFFFILKLTPIFNDTATNMNIFRDYLQRKRATHEAEPDGVLD